MSCCGDDVNRGGWGLVPELKLAGDALGQSSDLPRRAPGPGHHGWPAWVWAVLALGVLILWRRG